MSSVQLSSLSKTYPNGFQAVKGVDLDIADGELLVLVGPSGCGKSTTLRMIAGLEQASGGTIRIGDRVVNDVHPKDRDIAMVFQSYALYPHMTVRKNLSFALRMRKTPRDETSRRIAEASRMLGLDDVLDRKPAQLSGGQRQRVAVGRAVVRDPQVFLFDEPLSNLDAKLRQQTRGELKKLHRRLRTTTVYVTHDQEEAMTLGDRLVVMREGRLEQIGTPFEIFEKPNSRFVAQFVGTPPMNMFRGTIREEGGSFSFAEVGSGATLPLPRIGMAPTEEIDLGIRPQDISLDETPGSIPLSLSVEVIEPLGDLMDVSATTPGGQACRVRTKASGSLQAGETRPFYLDPHRLHVFESGDAGTIIARTGESRA